MLTSLHFHYYTSSIQLQRKKSLPFYRKFTIQDYKRKGRVQEQAVPGQPFVNEASEAERSKHLSAPSVPCKKVQKKKKAG